MKTWCVLSALLLQGMLLFAGAARQDLSDLTYVRTTVFDNRSVTSTHDVGFELSGGYEQDPWILVGGLRYQNPELTLALSGAHASGWSRHGFSFLYGGKLHAFNHIPTNTAVSLLQYCQLAYRTGPFRHRTEISASIGMQLIGCRSRYYDPILWGYVPHLRAKVTHSFGTDGAVSLFISTGTLTLEESQLALLYGLSLTLPIPDTPLSIQLRPLVRLSDYPNESRFVTMREFALSVIWNGSRTLLPDISRILP